MATYTSSITRSATAEYARRVPASTAATALTKALVACGIVFGPLFFVVAMSNKNWVGVFMAIGVAVVFAWVSAIAARFITESMPLSP